MSASPELSDLLLHHRVSQFLFHEVRLLDERKWEEWGALFTDDGVYWAPASPDQPDPTHHISLIYEDQLLRKVRIARFASPAAYSLQPFPRSAHFVGNIMIDNYDAATGEVTVNSRFQMIEYRRDPKQIYGGEYVHDLVDVDGEYRIRQKKVTLVNCNGAHQSSSVYF